MPQQTDFWWQASQASDLDPISAQVTTAPSEHGLPFLDRYANLDALSQAAEGKDAPRLVRTNPEICRAVLLSFQGNTLEAERVVRELARKNTHGGFAATIQLIARRLGLEFDN
jgi:hypothetical protein